MPSKALLLRRFQSAGRFKRHCPGDRNESIAFAEAVMLGTHAEFQTKGGGAHAEILALTDE